MTHADRARLRTLAEAGSGKGNTPVPKATLLELLDALDRTEATLTTIRSLPVVVPAHSHGGVHPPYLEANRVLRIIDAALAADTPEATA